MIDLDDSYWDCYCETNYIRVASKKNNSICPVCNASEEEMPSSRCNEMIQSNMSEKAYIKYRRETLKFSKSLQERDGVKYRQYTAKNNNIFVMIAGNIGECCDWGVYLDKEPVLRFPNLAYESGLSFKQAKEKAMEMIHFYEWGADKNED